MSANIIRMQVVRTGPVDRLTDADLDRYAAASAAKLARRGWIEERTAELLGAAPAPREVRRRTGS